MFVWLPLAAYWKAWEARNELKMQFIVKRDVEPKDLENVQAHQLINNEQKCSCGRNKGIKWIFNKDISIVIMQAEAVYQDNRRMTSKAYCRVANHYHLEAKQSRTWGQNNFNKGFKKIVRFWGLLYSLNLYILYLNAMFIHCHSYELDGPEQPFWNIETINMAHVHEKLPQCLWERHKLWRRFCLHLISKDAPRGFRTRQRAAHG